MVAIPTDATARSTTRCRRNSTHHSFSGCHRGKSYRRRITYFVRMRTQYGRGTLEPVEVDGDFRTGTRPRQEITPEHGAGRVSYGE